MTREVTGNPWWVMGRMSFVEIVNQYEGQLLLELAEKSIEKGFLTGDALNVDLKAVPDSLLHPGASFVTLNLRGQLRGCIGHLEATQALLQDVVENASLAAFSDPRFPPLTREEFEAVEISLSILSAPEPLLFDSEDDLLTKIWPGIDGLVLKEGAFQGTFLPSVWESLPKPLDFLCHLKQKAGLSADYWSDSIQILRYTTQLIKPPA